MASTVLLIQDDSEFELEFKEHLRHTKFLITQATSGFDGLKLASTQKFQYIFIDLKLQQINGLDIIRLLKWHPIGKNSKLIAISSNHLSRQQATTAGADYFLRKPFSVNDLMTALTIAR